MQEKLDLFAKLHNRQPIDSNEFVNFCKLIDMGSTTMNSRRQIGS